MKFQLLAVFLPAAAMLLAQSETASLSGIVTDPTEAVVPNVSVTATHEGTNQASSAATNPSGRYAIPVLRPCIYRVTAELKGFQRSVVAGVILQVNQQARLDIVLKVGEVAEQVSVTAEAALLETESSGRGAVIDQR
jgi:hypothetical protein